MLVDSLLKVMVDHESRVGCFLQVAGRNYSMNTGFQNISGSTKMLIVKYGKNSFPFKLSYPLISNPSDYNIHRYLYCVVFGGGGGVAQE